MFGFTVLLSQEMHPMGNLLGLSRGESRGLGGHLSGVWGSDPWAVGSWPPVGFLTHGLARNGQCDVLITFPKDGITACCTTQL